MSSNKSYDIWRDSPLRYAGYCNEVGEAFAPIYPRLLLPSYVLSVAYVIGDTMDKTYAEYNSQKKISQIDFRKIAVETGDVLTWQMFASVIVPGLTIKAVAKASTALFHTNLAKATFSKTICKFSPTALGLLAIPFIIKPIDEAVDMAMDKSYRQFFKDYFIAEGSHLATHHHSQHHIYHDYETSTTASDESDKK